MAKRNPHQLALEFRKQLVALDNKAAARIVDAYKPIAAGLERRLDEIGAAMQVLGSSIQGNPTPEQRRKMAGKLAEKVRTAKLLEQVATEVRVFAEQLAPALAAQQRTALNLGNSHAQKLLLATGQEAGLAVEWNHVPTPAIEVSVGYMGDGTPVAEFMTKKLGADVFQRMRSTILQGLASGAGIDETARNLAGALDGNRARAQTITRTETLRAYREAAREEYQANDDVVQGWVWTAAKDGRTCAVCWAMDGKKFDNEVPFASHVNCRCVARPYTKTFKELGLPGVEETRPEPEDGEKAFAKLPEGKQRAVLGKKAFELYKAGDLPLRNLVGYKLDDTWGPSRVRRSIADALKGTDERAFRRTRLRDKPKRDAIPEAPPAPAQLPIEEPAAPELTPTTPPAFQFPRDPDSLKFVKKLGGTTGAELVEDEAGFRFVRKRGASPEHLREEALADSIYRAAGVNVPDFRLYETGKGPVKLARFIEGTELSKLDPIEAARVRQELSKHFAVDAFLANQDVAGTGDDNVLIDHQGTAWRIDNGSSLRFRAQGGRKEGPAAFNQYPTHFFSMREKRFLAGKTFGDVDFYQAGRQITRLLDAREAIMRLVDHDPALQKLLDKRFNQFEHLEELAFQMENDKFTPDYANEMGRHLVTMRANGLFDKVADKLGHARPSTYSGYVESPYILFDEGGNQFDHLREKEFVKGFYDYMESSGAAAGHVGTARLSTRWSDNQAGDSWEKLPRAFKHVLMKQRNIPQKKFFVRLNPAGAFAEIKQKFGTTEEMIRHALVVQHAMTYHLLTTVDLPNANRQTRTMQLVRTDPSKTMAEDGKPLYEHANKAPVVAHRGAAESFSAYRWVSVHGQVPTIQELPMHRVFATYLPYKPHQGNADYLTSKFAGDGENEFIAMSEGYKSKVIERRGDSIETFSPGETARTLAELKEDWRTENRGGERKAPPATPQLTPAQQREQERQALEARHAAERQALAKQEGAQFTKFNKQLYKLKSWQFDYHAKKQAIYDANTKALAAIDKKKNALETKITKQKAALALKEDKAKKAEVTNIAKAGTAKPKATKAPGPTIKFKKTKLTPDQLQAQSSIANSAGLKAREDYLSKNAADLSLSFADLQANAQAAYQAAYKKAHADYFNEVKKANQAKQLAAAQSIEDMAQEADQAAFVKAVSDRKTGKIKPASELGVKFPPHSTGAKTAAGTPVPYSKLADVKGKMAGAQAKAEAKIKLKAATWHPTAAEIEAIAEDAYKVAYWTAYNEALNKAGHKGKGQ